MRVLLSILCLVALTGCMSTSNLEVVSDFEVERYTGTWYEAARFPHRFEKNLEAVSATYSLNEDGTVKVLNRGYNTKENTWDTIAGTAKFKYEKTAGWLKVSFFKPFWASYKVLYIDDAYTKALVTGPTYGYLWLLVRDPAASRTEWQVLIEEARRRGFDTDKLIYVDQTKNRL